MEIILIQNSYLILEKENYNIARYFSVPGQDLLIMSLKTPQRMYLTTLTTTRGEKGKLIIIVIK